jgi:C1A family cysteine protease
MRFLSTLALAALSLVSAGTHHHTSHGSSSLAAPSDKQLETMFSSFIKTHDKKYAHEEFFPRFNVFKANMEKIRKHNASGARFTMASNKFADLTWEEFRATRIGGYKNTDHSLLRQANAKPLDASAAPASVDWRDSQIVTDVKDQGQCGSCWAFSTTGSVESAVAQKNSAAPISLSEQQLVDCSTAQGNEGCNGGLMDYGFQYIISNNGIGSEASYPYTATGPNTCKKTATVSTISSFTDVPAGDETSLLAAVAQQPVSIAIEADQASFQFYSSGVLTAACGQNLDHGVLAVGYGTDSGTDYWIVKNSWGASWGEAGYIRLERGINQCGLANSASWPTA